MLRPCFFDRSQRIDCYWEYLESNLRPLARVSSSHGNRTRLRPNDRAHHRDRLKQFEHRSDGDDGHRKLAELHDEIELLLIAAERQEINQLFRNGKLNDEARLRIERELDLREAQLANQRAEE